MAYNILKGEVQFVNATSGTIESMVDDHSNQTIAGVKTFSTAITASGFYDALLGERIVNRAITNIVSGLMVTGRTLIARPESSPATTL